MQWLARICVQRPVFATVIALILTVLGAFSYIGLGVDRFPKVEFPFVTVTTVVPGSAPDQVETEVTDKIEAAVNTISGIDELRSVSVEGVSQVLISFVLEKDVEVAVNEVRERVGSVTGELPEGVDPPTIARIDPDATPILSLVVASNAGVRDVTEFADKKLRRELESLSGVGQVTIIGGRARQINVSIDPDRLRKHGLSATDVERALRTQNVELPSGRLEQGTQQLTLRTRGRVESIAALAGITVAVREGQTIRLQDVATVEDGMADPQSAGYFGKRAAVLLSIRKQSGTNTVEVVERVKERLDELQGRLPEGYSIEVARDQSEFVSNAIGAVKEHLWLGSLLAAVVVFLFLRNFRSTLISGVAIPVSVISTFALMRIAGFTLNMLTMLALTLAVGIVIDDAIVVLENIYRHVAEKGTSPREAAVSATKEIGLAVTATTLSLIVVFLPVAFMEGIVGRFMNSFGLTMAFAIAVSLIVSFVLTPMMSARLLKASEAAKAHAHGTSASGIYGVIERGYLRVLRWAMRHRWVIVVCCVVSLGATAPLGAMANKNFLPVEDESQFQATVRAPEGTSLDATRIIATRIASALEALPGVKYAVTTIADDPQQTPNLASIYVKLLPTDQRELSQEQLISKARSEVMPGFIAEHKLRASVGQVSPFSGGGVNAPVMIQVTGPDMSKLATYAEALLERLKATPGVADPDTSLIVGKPEVQVEIDRDKAADLGVSVVDIAAALRLLVGGYEVSTYNEGGEQYDVFVRAQAPSRTEVSDLQRLTVPSAKLGTITLDQVTRFAKGSGPSRIERFKRAKAVMLTANLQPGASQSAVIESMIKAADELKPGPDYAALPVGQSKELGRAFANFALAFVLSLIFMYLVLAAQFESWLHPITILLSLPLTVPFAILSVILFGQSLNIFSMLGILVLFGVVKKNSILQIDHTIQLRREGLARDEAILQANRDRLRPILMTTIAFVAGMIPLVVSGGAGAGTNRATGFVIIGGQTLALFLTLLATPVAYSLFDDLSAFVRRVFFRPSAKAGDAPRAAGSPSAAE